MKISHRWLQNYINIRLSPEKLAEGLSMLGLEVEKVDDFGKLYNGFVVGEVVSVEKHPNADRLTVCRVNVGKEMHQIVCGAPNVAQGQKVAVGLAGAVIPHDQHDPDGKPFVLQKTKIRGVESEGMICSAYELGVGDDANGILVLDTAAKAGVPLAQYLGKTDTVYEIEVTANRGDWLSHFGVVREISAMTGKPWKRPQPRVKEVRQKTSAVARVKINDKNRCPRYVARVFRNIKVGPSPSWLQDALSTVGVRPINNVVDVTNYVMLETGQPLHAFDYDRLAGHSIIVRCASEGEKFTTLDGKERTLRSDTLMICDAKGPVAVAGVMGGRNSEISDSTTSVLLESAYFDPAGIRRTSKYLGLSTEASQRFERSVDIEITPYAANRAAQLLQEVAGIDVLRGVIDVYPKKMKPKKTGLRTSRTNEILGTSLSRSEIVSFLKRLGLSGKPRSADLMEMAIPTHRNDLSEEIDLVEEVARMFGYNNVDVRTSAHIDVSTVTGSVEVQDELRNHLVGAGFNEMLTNSLQNKAHADLTGELPVEVLNPVSSDMEMLRTSLIPGVLDVIRHNQNHGQKGLRLFELGKVFRRAEGKSLEVLDTFLEEKRLLIALAGEMIPSHYSSPPRLYNFLDLKGEAQGLLSKFFLDKYRLIYYDSHKPLSVNNVDIEIQGTYTGFLGTLKKEIAAKFDIEGDVFVCDLNAEVLAEHWQTSKKFRALPRFPGVSRDLAFVVDVSVPQWRVEQAIRQAGGDLLTTVSLFDLYGGDRLGAGKKGLAYTIDIQPEDHTLTDAEANQVIARIVDRVKQECGATLRA